MKRFQNERHLAFVRTLGCATPSYECSGKVEAHHLLKPWDGGRGMGLKASDKNVIPLCRLHHRELHKLGNEHTFLQTMGYHEDYGRALSKRLWETSPVHGHGRLSTQGE